MIPLACFTLGFLVCHLMELLKKPKPACGHWQRIFENGGASS